MLWFAFILLSLSYWKQRGQESKSREHGCDLLSFYYLCRTGNNFKTWNYLSVALWFAFILLSLSYWKQRAIAEKLVGGSCDLLSFYYLCRTGNNGYSGSCARLLLWFAFILLSLSYWKQRPPLNELLNPCCDLLSFYYLCRTGNNGVTDEHWCRTVVICFHFTIFVVLETTLYFPMTFRNTLWFAFILLSLSYWKQLTVKEIIDDNGCDLLSFYYLCRTGNNVGGGGGTYI